MPIHHRVNWVQVNGKWTRYSFTTYQPPSSSPTSSTHHPSNNDDAEDVEVKNPFHPLTFLLIPGNPGNQLFYEHFILHFLHLLGEAIQVPLEFYALSHVNQVDVPAHLKCGLKDRAAQEGERFNLEDQIRHKVDFCREHLPKGRRVILMGHSIGALISLRILPELRQAGWEIVDCYALFPAVERMAETPSGQKIRNLAKFFNDHDSLSKTLLFWLNWLPISWKQWLCRLILGRQRPKCVVEAAAELFTSSTLRNICHMANHELNVVGEFDERLLDGVNALFYYATEDGWSPVEFAEQMKQRVKEGGESRTGVRVVLDEEECEHAFVMRHSEVVVKVLVDQFVNG